MAYITFIARDEYVASYQLDGVVTLGRSFDSDIFIPDVFVSRHHCRFEKAEQGWIVVDLDSTNGMYFKGQRVKRRTLHEGDVLELGSIAFIFDEADMEIPESSVAAPFGPGAKIAELIDTVCAFDARPSEYVKQNVRKAKWKLLTPEPPVEEEPELVPLAEDQGEWTELDLEFAISESDPVEPMMILVSRERGYAMADSISSMAGAAVAGGSMAGVRAGGGASDQPLPKIGGAGSFRQLSTAIASQPSVDETVSSNGSAGARGPKQVAFWESGSEGPAGTKTPKEKKREPRKSKEKKVQVGPSLRERIDELVETIVFRVRSNPMVAGGMVAALLLVLVGGYWLSNRDPYSRLQQRLATMSPEQRKMLDDAARANLELILHNHILLDPR